MADPGGMVMRSFTDGPVWMNTCRMVELVWHRGGVDGRPGKVDASVPALEMGWWKTAATACALDRLDPVPEEIHRVPFVRQEVFERRENLCVLPLLVGPCLR
ncbi:Serine carboxypeptidase-like 19 [Hordeum vulgare]|nr:Serine carboxypeptidase-like 19 [Hordeum vulgare]